MIKTVVTRALVIAGLIIAINLLMLSVAEATDYYVGNFRDGNKAYVVTESIKNPDYHDYKCTVKAVKGNNSFYIDYHL